MIKSVYIASCLYGCTALCAVVSYMRFRLGRNRLSTREAGMDGDANEAAEEKKGLFLRE